MSSGGFMRKFPGVKNPLFDEPWRNVPWGQREQEADLVKAYQPQSEAQQLRILMIGQPGSGKSSFINSVDSVVRGKIGNRAPTAACYGDSFTQEYRTYQIQKESSGNPYPFVFSDTMGIDKGSGRGIDLKNLTLIMKGHIKEGCKLDAGSIPTEASYNQNPDINDKVHVLVCAVDATKVDMMEDVIIQRIKVVREEARALRIPQIAVLTKIDEACPKVKKNIKNVYKSKILKKLMETVSGNLGFTMNCVFLVKNYCTETETDDEIDSLILHTMRKIIDYGEDHLNDIAPREDTKQLMPYPPKTD